MSRTATALLAIAAKEIGYKEKESNSQLDTPGANAGDENYTKYARDLHKAGYYQANKQGAEWCDMFVDWCFLQLCGSRAEAEKMICQTGLYGAGCSWSARYYKQQGRFFENPKPGDQIFFRNFGHTGLVEKISGSVITTIEGNTSNQVARRTYKLGSGSIDGYGRPFYDVEKVVENVEKPSNQEQPSEPERPSEEKTVDELAREVIAGKHGSGAARRESLGANYEAVQKRVNELLK